MKEPEALEERYREVIVSYRSQWISTKGIPLGIEVYIYIYIYIYVEERNNRFQAIDDLLEWSVTDSVVD